jgi:hypothetical protein
MEMLEILYNFIQEQIQERYFNGSGLSVKKMLFLDIHLYKSKTKFIKGSTYVQLPYNTINNKRKKQ